MAAEAEAVGHGRVEACARGLVRRVVQVAVRVGVLEVDRRRNHAVANRQHGEHQLDAAAGAQQVAQLALGAGDAHVAACSPKTGLMAAVSARSPRGVLVPWALM